jgi:biotin transport system ATP-binding protein
VPIIEIKNLTHRYADSPNGVSQVDLVVRRGELLVLAGANGSGKTTLLRHLNGLLLARQGSVAVDGVPVKQDVRRARRKVGMVFQEADNQIVGETVFADVAFGPENLGWPPGTIQSSVAAVLGQLGMGHLADRSPYSLSGGERRRLAIAGVLVMRPAVIVMDEPFANLDYPGVREILRLILSLHQKGHTLVISTHDLEKIFAHAQRLVVMHQGRIVADGRPEDLLPCVEAYDVRLPCAARMGQPVASWLS